MSKGVPRLKVAKKMEKMGYRGKPRPASGLSRIARVPAENWSRGREQRLVSIVMSGLDLERSMAFPARHRALTKRGRCSVDRLRRAREQFGQPIGQASRWCSRAWPRCMFAGEARCATFTIAACVRRQGSSPAACRGGPSIMLTAA